MKLSLDNKKTVSYPISLLTFIFILFLIATVHAQITIERSDVLVSRQIATFSKPDSPGLIKDTIEFDLSHVFFPFDTTYTLPADSTIDLADSTQGTFCRYFDFPIQLGDAGTKVLFSFPTTSLSFIYEADSTGILVSPGGNALSLRVSWSLLLIDNGSMSVEGTGYIYLTKSRLYAEIDDNTGAGGPEHSAAVIAWSGDGTTSIRNEIELLPHSFSLNQNYPNPFNPSTSISFDLPTTSKVTLTVFSLLGEKVRTILSGEMNQAGTKIVNWDGRDDFGNPIPSGVYFYQLQTNNGINLVRKMTLLK